MKVLKLRRKDEESKEKRLKRIEKFNGNPHIIVCEKCGSKLEIREDELKIEEDGLYSFVCPVCNNWQLIYYAEKWFGRLRKVISNLFKKERE
jgi:hypothetical protein